MDVLERADTTPEPISIVRCRELLGDEADALSDDEVRDVARHAEAMARVLIRERDRQKPDDEWFLADLSELARRGRMAYSTAKAALAELRHAGLLACQRHVVSRKVLVQDTFGAHLERVNAYERNWYAIVGRLRKRSGVTHLELGAGAWAAFVEARQRMSKAAVRLIASRPAWPKQVEWLASWVSELLTHQVTTSANDGFGLGTKSSTSVLLTRNKKQREASEKALARSLIHSRGIAEIVKHGPGNDNDEPIIGESFCFGSTVPTYDPRRDPHYVGPRSAPYIMPDAHRREPCPIVWLSPDMVPEQKATYVVDAYRRAVKKVFGIDWYHYFKGDITKSKNYALLVKAGQAFADHSVAPEHWAIWRLRWFASKGKTFKQMPPVWVVMSAKTVSEKAGWFRKDYDLPLPVFVVDPMIAEQHLRNLEASSRFWRKAVDPLMFLPRSYVEKRRHEIKLGMVDPHDNWPRRSTWRGDE